MRYWEGSRWAVYVRIAGSMDGSCSEGGLGGNGRDDVLEVVIIIMLRIIVMSVNFVRGGVFMVRDGV